MKTAIYIGASIWQDKQVEKMELSEQSSTCRAYMKKNSELCKTGTFTDRNQDRMTRREFDKMLVELQNRRFQCIVVATVVTFFDSSKEALYYIKHIMIPAGMRFIAVKEAINTEEDGWQKEFGKVIRKVCANNGKNE
ncbi:MAG: recombinase family protein [Lachnospiraceae bacterium]|nr:recombinase family protein [Lachnospiraceae bacterium]